MKYKTTKISNNELCPCGSKKKYKSCCKIRKDEKINLKNYEQAPGRLNAEVINTIRDNKFSTCLHPQKEDCSKRIINAHTLQNNGVLSYLAYNDEVIIIEPGVDLNGIKIDYKNKSKNKATTFTGFCSYHDKNVFKPIEDNAYDKNNDFQNFLFAYRIFAYEYYKKKVAFKSFQSIIKKRPSLLKQEAFVVSYRNYQLSIKDIESYSKIFTESILENSYSIFETKVIEFKFRLPFATCFAYSPEYDFNKKPLNISLMNDYDEERLKLNFITVLPQKNKSYIIYSWLKEDSNYFTSIKNSLENFDIKDIKRNFNNLIPEYSENIVLAPKYWEKLSPNQKKAFNNRVTSDFPSLYDDSIMFSNSINNKRTLDKRAPYNLFRSFDY